MTVALHGEGQSGCRVQVGAAVVWQRMKWNCGAPSDGADGDGSSPY